MLTRKVSFLGLISVFLAGIALGGEAIPNWPAPATWSPARAHRGLTTMGDVTFPLPFIGAAPCRISDTRGNGFMGSYGPPSLSQGVPRNFTLTGQCGIPAGAGAVSLNVTVTNTQGPGFILIYPAGGSQPTVSTLNYVGGQTIANAAVVPLGGFPGAITVVAGVSGTDLILDTNGYYASAPATATNSFTVFSSGSYAIKGDNTSDADGAAGVVGFCESSSAATRGVEGVTLSTAVNSAGVSGGAVATAGFAVGVLGGTASTSDHSTGVVGIAQATTGKTYGVQGVNQGAASDAAGVFGEDGTVTRSATGFNPAGVRGESSQFYGVVGTSRYIAVFGQLQDSTGALTQYGLLGAAFGTASDAQGPPWGVFSAGNLGATGSKHFVEPHATDASKVVIYSSLEGREVGTYFRGTIRTVRGQAVIEVPEDFRMVTDEEGLTVQLTPVGPLTMMSVESEDLDRIVVRSSKDVTFHYLVQGVRRAFKNFEPVSKGFEFMPHSAEERMPGYLTEEAKRRLIANGTYNADGTVNTETAERLGWTKMWAEREEQAKAAVAANAAAHAARMGERRRLPGSP